MRSLVPARCLLPLGLAAFVVAAASLLPGCGCGGGYVTPAGPTETLALASEAARDGWVAPGGAAVALATAGAVSGTGDHDQGGEARRQFFSFDLATLPAGAKVQSAILRLFQSRVDGTPYQTHGVVLVDHLVYDLLDAADYDRPALSPALGTLSSTPTLEFKALDVTAAVRADLASLRRRTQVRLRWSLLDSDGDPTDDQATFVDAEDVDATRAVPRLLVTYRAP